ncbi:hypothetical protein JM84_0661 [Dokdonia sp. Hel_I_63]|uniref:hypothetical protein n=1 Tax=Dokdonia sp. Hel_I_63 TaxID=1249996 RepID=UPI001198E7C3|nr:hypothetical protein [Dokdonia sp. Hel_I_63]TVZ21783.1 hypothetical protein JM84_0661 [Dokdonia sp. Hel_I_63]
MLKNIRFLIVTIIILSFSLQVKSQELGTVYSNYFELPRESIFLHLNKTTYITGEDIYFKAYIYNRQTGKPFSETTNLIVGIYDSLGNQVIKKQFISGNGFGNGHFELDSSFPSGSYYIKASTNWMKNFYEDDSFQQKITIYNSSVSKDLSNISSVKKIEFTPEGGSLVNDVANNVAIRVSDKHGYSKPFKKGIIKDQYGYHLTTFTPGKNNIAVVTFSPRATFEYSLEIEHEDGSKQLQKIAPPKKNAVGLAIASHSMDKIAITLRLDKKTTTSITNDTLLLLIHRDGMAKKIDLIIPKDVNYASYLFDKSQLHQGVNIFSLFHDSNEPIAERIYFNTEGIKYEEIQKPTITKTQTDSLLISLSKKTSNSLSNLSVSVLPFETISNTPSQNILSAFYLKPYLKNQTISYNRYFSKNTIDSLELDALLISQGQSRYLWKRILNNPPKKTYTFSQGVSIKGTLNKKLRSNEQLFLHAGTTYPAQTLKLENGNFTLPLIFPETEQALQFSILSGRGKLTKPSLSILSADILEKDFITERIFNKTNSFSNEAKILPVVSNFDDIEQLNEVILTGKKKVSYESSNPLVPSFLKNKVTVVTEDLVFKQPSFLDIIRSRGYTVREDLQFASTTRVQIRVRTQQSFGLGSGGSERAFPQPVIYFNDVKLIDFDILTGLRTEDLESFYFQRNGASEGVNGTGGVIRIYTRRNLNKPIKSDSKKEISNMSEVFAYPIKNGFEKEKKFIQPDYSTYDDKSFTNFGVIHWEPQLILDGKKSSSFNIKDTGNKKLMVHIEGMTLDGLLISTIKTLNLHNSN